MASNGKLFRPAADGARRDFLSNAQMNGNIMNPPRYAELGGFTTGNRGMSKNSFRIVPPGAGTRSEPISSN